MEADDMILDIGCNNNAELPYVTEVITDGAALSFYPNLDGSIPEYPIRIEKHGNLSHKTATHIYQREIHESYCEQEDCKFYGKHAAQGYCWVASDITELRMDKAIEFIEAQAEVFLKELQEYRNKGHDEEYIKMLEDHLVCDWINDDLSWEAQLRLRKENHLLKLQLGTYK
jgi:hypothetical protein